MTSYFAIRSEGGLLPLDILERVAREEVPGQKARDFGLAKGRRLSDEIASAWSDAQDYWSIFKRHRDELPEGETGTRLTRERWAGRILTELLGYELTFQPAGAVVQGKIYPISHRAGKGEEAPPVHIEGFRVDLDRRSPAGHRRLSPQALVQEYLNREERHLWGVVTNGLILRLLRETPVTARPSYLEFDLESILEGGRYNEFVLFYRLCHRTRLPVEGEEASKCLLETYYQEAVEQGGRVREKLRDGVEEALKIFGTGFLRHPANTEFRERLQSGKLTADQYHQQLLRLIYRLLFLMVAEERHMIAADGDDADRKQRIYDECYSVTRLRDHVEHIIEKSSHQDRWLGLKKTFQLFSESSAGNPLGIPPLNGDLFGPHAMPDLENTHLYNDDLIRAIRRLSLFEDNKVRRRVNYAGLDVEEMGSVYESLLDFQPAIEESPEGLTFVLRAGTERKSTGSYYTRPELVRELIQSALVPVMEERLEEVRRLANGEWRTEEEKERVHSILSRARHLATLHGLGGGSLPDHQAIPEGGDVRPDLADSTLGSLGPSEYRRRVGTGIDVRIPAVSPGRAGEPERTGNAPASLQPSRDLPRAGAHRNASNHINPGQADHNPPAQAGGKAAVQEPREASASLSLNPADLPFATRYSLLAEQALLGLKVCDPACGSGHFLLAAARRLGRELARIRTGEEEPTPREFHLAVRDVISHCIYGVDVNPLAVDLCKLSLWLEGHWTGKPLSFLDHHIKCGNSLIGVFDLGVLKEGIPDDAFKPVTGDDKKAASAIRKRNKRERESPTRRLPFEQTPLGRLEDLAQQYAQLGDVAEDSPADVKRKAELYRKVHESPESYRAHRAANLWTAAFFAALTDPQHPLVPTTERLWEYMERPNAAYAPMIGLADSLALKHKFFHWFLEFPEVFAGDEHLERSEGSRSGFDVVLGNPPWERIKLQEEEFFATRDREIAQAPNKAAREALIDALPRKNPALAREFAEAKHAAEAGSKFAREGGRFPLTSRGDINTYALFAELARWLMNPHGRAGLIVPTGIATDDTCKDFFSSLNGKRALASLFDFENREALFPGVHRSYKFSLLTISGRPIDRADFAFFSTRTEHLRDAQRRFTLRAEDLALLNPNTRTCPVFRTRADAELTKKIYERVPVLVNERTGENPWGIQFLRMFDMANDSHLFQTAPGEGLVPLYEAKMLHQFDHRWATYDGGETRDCTLDEKRDPCFAVQPRYWVPAREVDARLEKLDREGTDLLWRWERQWLLGFRDITNATNERTAIFSLLPRVGVGHTAPLVILGESAMACSAACLLGSVNSIALDYVARQKVGGTHLTYGYLNQLPVLPPGAYETQALTPIVPRVIELVYTAWDIKAFADDLWRDSDENLRQLIRCQWEENKSATGGHEWNPPEWVEIDKDGIPLPPFKWDEDRRAHLRAELDAYYALLYGLNRKQLRYILDPPDLTQRELEDILDPWEEVTDPLDDEAYRERMAKSDFPGETFRVLKEKELKLYGEYRTRRLVLEAYEKLAKASRFCQPPAEAHA